MSFFRVLRRKGKFEWTNEYQQAFEGIKSHLAELPLLTKLVIREALYLYIIVGEHSISSVLVKKEGIAQIPVYFVSKVLQGLETRYTKIEKAVQAVMTTSRKLRAYFLSHLIKFCTNLSFKQTLGRPDLSVQMVMWAVELGEYKIEFEPCTTIKAQTLAYFLQETTQVRERKEWKAFVDGSVTKEGGGIGVRILTPEGDDLRFALHFDCAILNNEAEYKVVLNVAHMLVAMSVEDVVIFTDSQLVA